MHPNAQGLSLNPPDLGLTVPAAWPPSPLLSSGILYVNGSLDFETSPKYFLSIECSRKSSSSLSDVTTIVINVTDVNEHHPRFTHDLYTVKVLENAVVGDVILTVRTPASLFVGCGLWGWLLPHFPQGFTVITSIAWFIKLCSVDLIMTCSFSTKLCHMLISE